MNVDKFIEAFAPACQEAMRKHGQFASVRLAQIAIESNWGEDEPLDLATSRRSFNLTGVKGVGPAGSVRAWTWEVENGEDVRVIAEFRAYHDYGEHIIERDRIFIDWPENYGAYLNARNPEEACKALQSAPAPYATDPQYAEKLIAIIVANDFKRFDSVFLDVPDNEWYADDVRFLRDAGIVNGDENGNYRPDDSLTRAEVARLLRLTIRYVTGR